MLDVDARDEDEYAENVRLRLRGVDMTCLN
jgi:hypothetical protein